MSFPEAMNSVFSDYAVFSGRACRSEYWYFVLVNVVVSVFLRLLLFISQGFIVCSYIWWIAMLIPALSVAVRRLHDTGKPTICILLLIVPVVGWILLLIFYVLDSQPGDNKYGPNPKE